MYKILGGIIIFLDFACLMSAQCSTFATLTLSLPAEATHLYGCRTFTGSIAICHWGPGAFNFIDLSGIQEIIRNVITGPLYLQALNAPELRIICGGSTLKQTIALSQLVSSMGISLDVREMLSMRID